MDEWTRRKAMQIVMEGLDELFGGQGVVLLVTDSDSCSMARNASLNAAALAEVLHELADRVEEGKEVHECDIN